VIGYHPQLIHILHRLAIDYHHKFVSCLLHILGFVDEVTTTPIDEGYFVLYTRLGEEGSQESATSILRVNRLYDAIDCMPIGYIPEVCHTHVYFILKNMSTGGYLCLCFRRLKNLNRWVNARFVVPEA
jgi:hypothetical protein